MFTSKNKDDITGAVVVAQLTEWSLPTPEIRSSNPDIGNEIFQTYLSVNCYSEKTKIKKKKPGMAHSKKYRQTFPSSNSKYHFIHLSACQGLETSRRSIEAWFNTTN